MDVAQQLKDTTGPVVDSCRHDNKPYDLLNSGDFTSSASASFLGSFLLAIVSYITQNSVVRIATKVV